MSTRIGQVSAVCDLDLIASYSRFSIDAFIPWQQTESVAVSTKTQPSINPPLTSPARKTVNVLHLINGEHFSGAERVQDLLGLTLPQFGFDVGFLCLKPERFPVARQSQKCPIFEVAMRNKFDVLRANEIAAIARQHDYQMLHAHTPRTLLLGRIAARKLRCPLVYHVHSPVGRDSNRSLNNRINTWIEKWSLQGVDQMICVSNSLAQYMKELGHPAEKISVVNNGVSVVEGPAKTAPESSEWTLGVMALFRPRKGTEVLLDAVGALKSEGITIKIRAVGPFETPDYETEIMNRVDDLGIANQITWTGFQTDVDAQLQAMDLFVLPSLYGEGLPMVILEAMANGVPVIASDVEGITEAVRDNVDGLIVKPGCPIDLAAKIKQILGDTQQWQRMSTEARDRQREHLSNRSMARGVAKVYKRLLELS